MNDNKILSQIENIEKALKELKNIIEVSSEDSECVSVKEQTVSGTITEEVFDNLPARYIAEESVEESDEEDFDPDEFDIEDEVLYDYLGKREEVNIPYGIRKIGKSAFQNNQTLKKVNFPETLREIGENAFLQCSNLVEVNNSEKVRKIGAWAFERCYRLEKIDIDSVKCVCFCAFENCTSLEMLTFSENTEMIEDYAFCNCKNLVVSIPQTCECGEDAFKDCKSVEVRDITE
ncbi:MAG: leucine-rich repeat domain-containing protein [Ruminococcus sp.]|nr:leucine-rich repeat domain-containing protein [Ruminococcus sp.]